MADDGCHIEGLFPGHTQGVGVLRINLRAMSETYDAELCAAYRDEPDVSPDLCYRAARGSAGQLLGRVDIMMVRVTSSRCGHGWVHKLLKANMLVSAILLISALT